MTIAVDLGRKATKTNKQTKLLRTSQADLHFNCSQARKNNSDDVVHIGLASRKSDFLILLHAYKKDAHQPAHSVLSVPLFT